MKKTVVRMKRIKVLHGNCVRFDPVDLAQRQALNGMYINADLMLDAKDAEEIKVTIEVTKVLSSSKPPCPR